MIVEMIGAPGAGKTSLLPALHHALRDQGLRAYTAVEAARPFAQRTLLGKMIGILAPPPLRGPLLWQVFYRMSLLERRRFERRYPGLIQHVIDWQHARPPGAAVRRRRVLHWFFRLCGDYAFLARRIRAGEALLFDEGFVHRVVQLGASPVEWLDPLSLQAYLNLIPKPDLVVAVRAPREVCLQRIYARGLWEHFSGATAAEVGQFVLRAHEVVEFTVGEIKRRGWRLVEVDNGAAGLAAAEADLHGKLCGGELLLGVTLKTRTGRK